MIRFLNPEFLWLLALLPLLALWRGRKGRVAAVEYSNVEIARAVAQETRSRPARWTTMLRLLVATLLIFGLSRPQWGRGRTEVQASGVDLMLALDVSSSMEALDFNLGDQPASRVEVVKSVVAKFIQARPNDRIGMIAFAGAPYLVSPLTLDHPRGTALLHSLLEYLERPLNQRMAVLLNVNRYTVCLAHIFLGLFLWTFALLRCLSAYREVNGITAIRQLTEYYAPSGRVSRK